MDDSSFGIDEVTFVSINFKKDWPQIIEDLAYILTGMNLLKSQRINEVEETVSYPKDFCKEADLQKFRNGNQMPYMMTLNAFRTLEGKEERFQSKADVENYL